MAGYIPIIGANPAVFVGSQTILDLYPRPEWNWNHTTLSWPEKSAVEVSIKPPFSYGEIHLFPHGLPSGNLT